MRLLPTRTLICIVILFIISSSVFGQTTKEEKEKKELQKKAIAILDGIVSESGSYPTVTEQLYVQIKAAKLLWKHDEPRARAIINEIKGQLIAYQPQQTSHEFTADLRAAREPETLRKMRSDLLKFIATADATLALDFLQGTRVQKSETKSEGDDKPEIAKHYSYSQTQDKVLEAEIASRAAKTNPQFAYQIASDLLKEDTDPYQASAQIIEIWKQLRIADSSSSERLAREILQGTGTDSGDLNSARNYMIVPMLQTWASVLNSESGSGKSKDKIPPLSSNEQRLFKELLEVYINRISSLKDGEELTDSSLRLFDVMNTLMPHIEKSFPSRVAALKKIQPAAEKESVDWGNAEALAELDKKSVQELLVQAENSVDGQKEMIFFKALEKATQNGDLATAEKIRDDHLKNPYLKKAVDEMIDAGKAKSSLKDGSVDDTIKSLIVIKDENIRISTMMEYAAKHIKNNNKEAAGKFIEAALGIIGGKTKTYKQLFSQISVATTLVDIDMDQSLGISAVVVDRLDYLLTNVKELISFATAEDYMPTMLGEMASETENFPYITPFVNLLIAQSGKDIDKTFGTLNRAQNRDAATMIGLFVLTGILN